MPNQNHVNRRPLGVGGFPAAVLPRYATIPHWCDISGYGRTRTYEDIGAGKLKAIKLGTRTLIDVQQGHELHGKLGRPRYRRT